MRRVVAFMASVWPRPKNLFKPNLLPDNQLYAGAAARSAVALARPAASRRTPAAVGRAQSGQGVRKGLDREAEADYRRAVEKSAHWSGSRKIYYTRGG